ncbi:MAG: DUF362 domain-containing protein [Bacilli bacterium]|nr:DUF362 domain-containing protein [Bacilli bacterium]
MKAKIYFTKEISPDSLVKIFNQVGKKLEGKVAFKVHSGEHGNQNYLHPEFMEKLVKLVGGTVVECNTAYGGARNSSDKHLKLLAEHEWTKYYKVDLLDEVGPDVELDIPNGITIKKDYVGKNLLNYDSMLVCSHFKGHPMGGFGGALKQLSIGCASSAGKAYIHSAGRTLDQYNLWNDLPAQDRFLESMADAASAVHTLFKDRIVYINIMCNLSVDCDCCEVAEDPCMADIGILASTDPIAIDQACIDLIKKSDDKGKDHFMARVNRQNGEYILDAASRLGFGDRAYELINID